MRKHFLKLFILFMFFMFPLVVNAKFGDLRYEVTDIDIKESTITFKGWAFIHRTNNWSGTDHKISIRALDSGGNVIETKEVNGSSDKKNYNFYCELFYKVGLECTKDNYLSNSVNECKNESDGDGSVIGGKASQCWYEDLYFEISFDVSGWNDGDFIFQIAASNNDFEYKKGHTGSTDLFTNYENLFVSTAILPEGFSNEYIDVDATTLSSSVKFIAASGVLKKPTDVTSNFKYTGGDSCTYGDWDTSSNTYELVNIDNYADGRSSYPSTSRCYDFLDTKDDVGNVKKCIGTHNYAISVNGEKKDDTTSYGTLYCDIASPCDTSVCYTAIARGSHIKLAGTTAFKINVKSDKKCPVTTPLPSELSCNDSGTLSSVCDELTVHTDKGSAIVKIEQTGTVSSVLTPNRTYAGGGFKFGIMYYNNIKWSYVGSYPGDELHSAINTEMNAKLKDYDAYIAGITITNLKLGDNSISSGMVRQCSSSSASKDYYGSAGLSVSCVFTFPSSTISYDGTVKYNSVSNTLSFGINNKYYTLLDKNGKFSVTATINGMDRITDGAAMSDSAEEGKPWTGTWVDSIDGCEIELYPLLYNSDGKYKFIYRPIDIYNPFPNRNAGINWYDWYNNTKNKERLENTYSVLQYTATINNSTMNEIKNYNKEHNYLDWDSIDDNGNSSFIDDYDYVKREGGS